MRRRSKMQNMETPSDVEMEVDSHDSLNADIDDTSGMFFDIPRPIPLSPSPFLRPSTKRPVNKRKGDKVQSI